ncbi:MAG TPA: PKD domain-containing protein, partial [Candidatus Paceibacterota bacterium]|nr:PKD domain-containing protein [Candidatus Paceibacterota bacterium]
MIKKIVAAIFMCAVMVLVAAVPLALADTHLVMKGDGGPRSNAVTWEYTPPGLGIWNGYIVNSGLRSLVVDVYDSTNGGLDEIMHQRIRFAAYEAYPSGTVNTSGALMASGHVYSITVTPNGPKGSTCTVEDMFDMAAPPVAVITIVSINYLDVVVSGSLSSDADGSIVSYEWDFGDGGKATGVDASHSYAMDGTYTITLLVTDDESLSGSASTDVTVAHEHLPPVASFTAEMNWMDVSVDASGSTDNYGPIAAYDWAWGDGMTGSGMMATHTYSAEGWYTIVLTVTDSDGESGTAVMDVEAKMPVLPKAPIAMMTATVSYLDVAVDSAGSYDPDGTIESYAWTFGDGGSATGPTASHSYAMDGDYLITLTVTDNSGMTGTASQTVTVMHQLIPPVAMFTWDIVYMVVSVDASGSTDNYGPIAAYDWAWGDGMTGSGKTATHTYALEGAYTIVLTVTDSDGQTGTASADVTATMPIEKLPPIAVIALTSQHYLDVAVDGSGSYDQ